MRPIVSATALRPAVSHPGASPAAKLAFSPNRDYLD